MHRGTPDGHITSENRNIIVSAVVSSDMFSHLSFIEHLPFETLKLASPLPGASAAKTSFQFAP